MFYPSKYGFIRVAVASPELRVGNIPFNISEIAAQINVAEELKCSLIVFPELSITSYSCADLFYNSNLIRDTYEAIENLRKISSNKKISFVVGAPIPNNGRLFNCALFFSEGKLKGIVPKTYLVNVNEYYEERWFSSAYDNSDDIIDINGEAVPFGADLLFKPVNFPGCKIGIEICEDLWTVKPPSSDMSLAGANIILNLSASDEYLGKKEYRKELVRNQSGRCFCAYLYSSSGPWESSTDLVFSGHSLIAENNFLLQESQRFSFKSEIIFSDIDIDALNNQRLKNNSFSFGTPSFEFRNIEFNIFEHEIDKLERFVSHSPFIPLNKSDRKNTCDEIFHLQTTGLARRLLHINSKKLILGLSGGLDSTLALIVAVKTFDKLSLNLKGIVAITMPGFGTTSRTLANARKLAEILKVTLKEVSIVESVKKHFEDIGHNPNVHDIVFENSQARERTQILMDFANKENGIVLGTGDLSELALGWSTYNGDHMSMYNVNSSVPKSLIRYIIEWAAENEFQGVAEAVLKDVAETPISPELLPADVEGDIIQKTESEIGPYILHDFFLFHLVRNCFAPDKIVFLALEAFQGKFTESEIKKWCNLFFKRFFSNQYKRSCMPDGVKVGSVALSPRGDWRMPSDADSEIWLKYF